MKLKKVVHAQFSLLKVKAAGSENTSLTQWTIVTEESCSYTSAFIEIKHKSEDEFQRCYEVDCLPFGLHSHVQLVC